MPDLDARALLAAYDEQARVRPPRQAPAGVRVERDGPLVRLVGRKGGGFVEYRDLAGLEGAALDELIERQISIYAARGERFEWKLHGHDLPADLPDRLRAAGFVPEEVETVVIADAARVAGETRLPAGVKLREVSARTDLDRLSALETAVYGTDLSSIADNLEGHLAADPDSLTVVLVEDGGTTVSAGWIQFTAGTEFASLWGGATLPAWRSGGIYRALVAYRANLAVRRGMRYVQVDASSESRPILERLGFVAVTTTTPYIWTPPGGGS